MRKISLTELLPDIILRFHREQRNVRVPIYLTLHPDLPAFTWMDNGLEMMLFNLFNHAILEGNFEGPIRIAVAKRKAMIDLESLVDIHPSCWIQLRMDVQSISELDDIVKKEIGNSGFSAEDEWALEGAPHKLIAYAQKNDPAPQLLCWIEHNRASHRYTILIPIRIEHQE